MELHLIAGASNGIEAFWSGPLGTVLIASAGALVTAALTFANTNLVARAQHNRIIRTTRVIMYAQLHRLAKLCHGQLKYLADPEKPKYIWIPIYNLNLPSLNTIDQIRKLTPIEVMKSDLCSTRTKNN